MGTGNSNVNRFTGELLSSRPLLVDTVRLFDLATGSRVSAIQHYPHYVEPTLVLVQRLLNQRDLGAPFNTKLPAEATVAVTISRDAQAVFATTLLRIKCSVGHLSCRIVSEEDIIEETDSTEPWIRHTTASAVELDNEGGELCCSADCLVLDTDSPARRSKGIRSDGRYPGVRSQTFL